MEDLLALGYTYIEDKKTFIEFRTQQFSPYVRIKVRKDNFEITKDTRSRQGNRGHINIKYCEFNAIGKLLDTLVRK